MDNTYTKKQRNKKTNKQRNIHKFEQVSNFAYKVVFMSISLRVNLSLNKNNK